MAKTDVKGLVERLKDGETVICAEGYLWELERRGYLRSGVFTPEVVIDHPERVRNIHEEFVHAGSDVVEAFTVEKYKMNKRRSLIYAFRGGDKEIGTFHYFHREKAPEHNLHVPSMKFPLLQYYGHRAKLRTIGREDELEALNLAALKLARDVADRTGCLMAGNLSNTTSYDPADPASVEEVKGIFKEQVEWAVLGKADYIIAETFDSCSEATLALEAILKYGNGLPAVITLCPYVPDRTTDDVPIPLALRKLEEAGASVVGLNCGRGPATMLPLLRDVRRVCKGPIAALPVPFRTTPEQKTFQSLTDPVTGARVYPIDLASCLCNRGEVREFARQAREIGVQYIGLCCGSSSYLLREVALSFGRNPPSMKYEPDLTKGYLGSEFKETNERKRKVRAFMLGDVQ